jgi:formamidopyrimidine-DNA glycosylase
LQRIYRIFGFFLDSLPMPELPEVETMVRGIRPHLVDRRIEDVRPGPCRCRPILIQPGISRMRKLSVGQQVTAVNRRAKRVVITLANSWSFVIEPRMTGLMLVDEPPSREHLRFEWQVRQGRKRESVWFWDRRGLGTLRLLSPSEKDLLLGEDQLGPDALEMTPATWQERLHRTRRAIKVALLDQKLVAGIGNLYASEILHRAGIHPARPADQLSARMIARLQSATVEILEEAILHEGSTLGDGTYRNALNKSGGYQNKHRVYARGGETCPTCGNGTIQRTVQAQRSTFHCARCQK